MTATPVPMTTLTEVVSTTSSFISGYAVFITAGMVLGLAGYLLRRLVKSGR